jgi:hypothetical protein
MREIVIAGKEYVLRYRLSDREVIEEKLGGKALWDAMTSGTLKDQATLIWGGLKHADRKLTPGGVIALLEQHLEKEDDYVESILRPAYWALLEGKLLGSFNPAEMKRLWGDPDAPKGEAPKAVAAGQNP